MTHRRFVLRTIRNGQIKVFGKTMHCDTRCPHLEGMALWFGLYWAGASLLEHCHLWGTQEMYANCSSADTDAERVAAFDEGKKVLAPRGTYLWDGWHTNAWPHCTAKCAEDK